MSFDLKTCAQGLIKGVGGRDNILSFEQVSSRLSFQLEDDDQADKPALRNVEGVVGVYWGKGLEVMISGGAAGDVLAALSELMGGIPKRERHILRKEAEKAASLREAKAGEEVTFGLYEQGRGAEPIEWLVIDDKGPMKLLLSKYVIEYRTWDEKKDSPFRTGWERCTLREWLNDSFYRAAFTDEERARIYRSEEGDKIFLLSYEEAESLFQKREDRICLPTAYAESLGAKAVPNEFGFENFPLSCSWLLKTGLGDYVVGPNGGVGKLSAPFGRDGKRSSRHTAGDVDIFEVGGRRGARPLRQMTDGQAQHRR